MLDTVDGIYDRIGAMLDIDRCRSVVMLHVVTGPVGRYEPFTKGVRVMIKTGIGMTKQLVKLHLTEIELGLPDLGP